MQTCAEVPFKQQLSSFQKVLSTCRKSYPGDPLCGGVLGSLIHKSVLTNLLTNGQPRPHRHCSNKLFVSVSALDPLATTLSAPKSWTISNFTSVADMAEIAQGTDYISCFMAPKPYTVVRKTPVIDGGYTSGFAQFCPPNVKRCIKIASFTVGANNPTGQIPDCKKAFSLHPPITSRPPIGAPNTLPQDDWKLPSTCQYDPQTKAITGPQQPPFVAAENPDIFPGNPYNALKHDPCLWQSWAMSVTAVTPEVITAQYDQGAADAAAWLKANRRSVLG